LIEPYAVASRDAAKAKKYAKTWGFGKSYGSYEDLLADPDVDFVYIPLPLQDAINNMAVIDALFASASSGKWEAVARL
jgi:predicted dehydrogenase